jgi:hypothetical protein
MRSPFLLSITSHAKPNPPESTSVDATQPMSPAVVRNLASGFSMKIVEVMDILHRELYDPICKIQKR